MKYVVWQDMGKFVTEYIDGIGRQDIVDYKSQIVLPEDNLGYALLYVKTEHRHYGTHGYPNGNMVADDKIKFTPSGYMWAAARFARDGSFIQWRIQQVGE